MEGTNKSYVSRINCSLLCCCVQVSTQHLHCRNKLAVWLLLPPSEETVVYFAELFCSYLSLVMLQDHRFGYASRPQVRLCFKTTGICLDIVLSYTSNSCKCMGVNGEALQLHAVYREPYFLLQVTRESISVLQVCLVS